MAKRYIRLNWQNRPSVATPINAVNLNKMDKAIDDIDNAIEEIYAKRVNNVVTTNTDTFLAGSVGKLLQDQITTLDNNLGNYNTLTGGITIPSGADLNNYTTPGIYICDSAVIASTLLNCPYTSGGFRLTVMRSTGSTNFTSYNKQHIDANISGYFFERNLINGTWGIWWTFGGESEWINPTLTSNFNNYLTNIPVRYKRIGNMVHLKGSITPTSTITANSEVHAFTIVSGYRPINGDAVFVCQGSGINRWMLRIKTNGEAIIERYGTNTFNDIPSGAWLTFEVTFTIN